MRSRFALVLIALAALFILSGCQISLAGDVTPPPGYRPPSPAPQSTQPAVMPVVPPDPGQGAALYAEKCAPCHGVTGMGDGSQAAKLPSPVKPIGTAEAARDVKPITWFNIITQGKIERMMPPFQSLSDRQRWDLVAYLFTLSTPQKTIEAGKTVFEEKCQACHGAKGGGDGTRAASLAAKVPDWRDLSRLAQLATSDIVNIVSNGKGSVMPSFANQLNGDQRLVVAAYVRTLNYASNGAQASTNTTPAPTPAPTALASTPSTSGTPSASTAPLTRVTFSGKVTHNAGKTLPEGLKVTLQGYDQMEKSWEVTAEIKNGAFEFKDIELVTDRIYMASVMFQNIEFVSDAVHTADLGGSPVVDLSVTLYDTSTDASVLSASRVHIFFDFTMPGRIQVAELFIISNPTTSAIVPASATQPALTFDLPAGFANLQFQDGELGGRFIQTEKGFGDLLDVQPSTMHQVLFGYDLPYTNNTASFSIPFSLPVDTVVLMTPADGVTVQSASLVSSGNRQVESNNVNLYTGSGFKKDSSLAVTVSGQPTDGATVAENVTSSNGLLIGLGVFGVALIIAGVFLFRQKQTQKEELEEEDEEEEESEEDAESILDAILALDDLHQAGQLSDEVYAERRAELKARYKALKE